MPSMKLDSVLVRLSCYVGVSEAMIRFKSSVCKYQLKSTSQSKCLCVYLTMTRATDMNMYNSECSKCMICKDDSKGKRQAMRERG